MQSLKIIFLLLLVGCTPGGHFAIHEENDYFAGTKTDRFYTQGAKFTYSLPAKADGSVDSLSVGNSIYTPQDKHTADAIPWQRPYAGYSYAEAARTRFRSENVQDRFALQAGLIGPGSGGKLFQCSVHKFLGQRCPDGWANQLKDEPTFEFLAEERKRIPVTEHFDTVLNYGADLGNVRIAANTGFLVRLGILGQDFGPTEITPRAEKVEGISGVLPGLPNSQTLSAFSNAYLFAGATGHAVARNIFLDGNTWEDSQRVTKEPLVADLKFGFTMQYEEYKLTYTWDYITDEYYDSKSAQAFGSVDISWGW